MKRFLILLLLSGLALCLFTAAKPAEPRSGHWPTLRASFLKEHPTCAACGTKENLTVHHVIPFHIDPAKELDPANLITLCDRCHLVFGHLLDWQSYNVDVRKDAAAYLAKVQSRPGRGGAKPEPPAKTAPLHLHPRDAAAARRRAA